MNEIEERVSTFKESYSREELLKMALETIQKNDAKLWETSNTVAQLKEQSNFMYLLIRAII